MHRNKLNVKLKAEEAIKESFMILKSINDSLYSNWSNCIDPTQEEKTKAIAKMVYLFHKTSGFLELDVLKLIYANIIHDQPSTKAKEVPIYSRIKNDCSKEESVFNVLDLQLCPTYTVMILREDMFPSIITETKCSCEKCQHHHEIKDDIKHSCQPIKILSPALIRGNCTIKGFYEWKPILEYISVGCLCSRSIY